MLSELIIASNQLIIEKYISDLCKREAIDPLDINIISTEENISIGDIRETIRKIFFKPIKSQQKIVVIKKINTASLEAQNALLKILEEPPINTGIILFAETKDQVLPTILSRCKIVKLKEEIPLRPIEQDFAGQAKDPKVLFEQLSKMSPGEKLKIAQDLAKNKAETLFYLTRLLETCEEYIKNNPDDKIIEFVENTLEAYKLASITNVNLRFTLEHLFLSYDYTKHSKN